MDGTSGVSWRLRENQETDMGGMVTMVKRENGQIKVRRMHTSCIQRVQDLDFIAQRHSQWMHRELEVDRDVLAPFGYGIVVVDFDTHWIGSAQGYTDPGVIYAGSLTMLVYGKSEEIKSDQEMFNEALKAGVVRRGVFIEQRKEDEGAKRAVSILCLKEVPGGSDFEDIIRGIENGFAMPKAMLTGEPEDKESVKAEAAEFLFEPEGWKIESYEENCRGYLELAKAMIARGFDLWPEQTEWSNFVDGIDEENPGKFEMELYEVLTAKRREQLEESLPKTDEQGSAKARQTPKL